MASKEREAGRSGRPLTPPVVALWQPETRSRVQNVVNHASQPKSFCSCETTKDLRNKNDTERKKTKTKTKQNVDHLIITVRTGPFVAQSHGPQLDLRGRVGLRNILHGRAPGENPTAEGGGLCSSRKRFAHQIKANDGHWLGVLLTPKFGGSAKF